MNWDDRVRKARQTDLALWLLQNNEPLKRIGRWWYIEGYDSLRIQGNMWYRYSRKRGGNPIDFLVDYYGLSAKEAIEMLTQDYGQTEKKNCGVEERKKFLRPATSDGFDTGVITPASDHRRVIAYLVITRGISADVVMSEIQEARLFQESRTGNAVFVMTSEAGDIVGAEVLGTLSNFRFKGIKAGSVNGYGYTVGQIKNPRYILYFESAVDLLSFITIARSRAKPLTACLLVSMAGLKLDVIRNTFQVFGNSAAIPVICVDNDRAGSDFTNRYLNLYPAAIINKPDKKFKDWNDQLRGNIICFV